MTPGRVISHLVFKLKHDIANDSELPLAALELQAIVGSTVQPVRNILDAILAIGPLRDAVERQDATRVQDFMLRLPYAGSIQAYLCAGSSVPAIGDINRLTYFREVLVVGRGNPRALLADLGVQVDFTPLEDLRAAFGQRVTPAISVHQLASNTYLLRIIPSHCFLECTDHVVRLAQRLDDVDRMYAGMLRHFHQNFDRPFAASVQMGYKWIEDFIDDRRPPNAYGAHALFGLRGRFFPRMVRALANSLNATDIVDPFAGVGTLGLECALLGVPSRSFDINPLFMRVAAAKARALRLDQRARAELESLRTFCQAMRVSSVPRPEPVDVQLPATLTRNVSAERRTTVGALKAAIAAHCSEENVSLAELGIAYYARSMLSRYSWDKSLKAFWAHISRILYLDRFLGHLYADGIIQPPVAPRYATLDVRELSSRVGACQTLLTSPPYTTAIDYVGNDAHGLYALGFDGHAALDAATIGSTRGGRLSAGQQALFRSYVPAAVQSSHERVVQASPAKADYLAKYFADMSAAMCELGRVVVPGGQLVMVVCDRQEFGRRPRIVYPVAEGITEIAQRRGFRLSKRFDVDLTKNSDGDIAVDSVLFFDR